MDTLCCLGATYSHLFCLVCLDKVDCLVLLFCHDVSGTGGSSVDQEVALKFTKFCLKREHAHIWWCDMSQE